MHFHKLISLEFEKDFTGDVPRKGELVEVQQVDSKGNVNWKVFIVRDVSWQLNEERRENDPVGSDPVTSFDATIEVEPKEKREPAPTHSR